MTALPASRMGLQDRRLARSTYKAYLVLFDPAKIIDKATFKNPHCYPEGISMVMVNGKVSGQNGKLTGERAGRVLRKP
ncbi:MAG: hypothetical protein EHM85_16460 [Desulfobacteraceae bacterium]|nr:MAG: hypothetical protein EHM85_16460 [Desulfobacteraceae bacterium]